MPYSSGVADMALIGSIDIGMRVNLSGFRKGVGQAVGGLHQFGTSVSKIGGLAAGLIGAVSLSGLALWAKDALMAADKTYDMAQQIGTTTEGLTSLRYAAKLTGSEVDTLDGAMQKMVRILGDEVSKAGPASATLEKLGLSAKKLALLDPSQAFLKIATAISGVKNPALQASYAVDLFGKTGVNLLNTLRAGPEELAKLTTEASRFGLSLSAIDTAKIGAANDSIDRATYAFKGLGNTLSVAVAPAVMSVLETFSNWIVQVRTGEGLIGTLSTAIGSAFSLAGVVVRNFGSLWKIAQIKITEFIAQVIVNFETFGKNMAIVADYVKKNWWTLFLDAVDAADKFFSNMLTNAKNFGIALWDAMKGKGFKFEFKPLLDGFRALSEKFPDLIKPEIVSLQAEIDAELKKIAKTESDHQDKLNQAAKEANAGRNKKDNALPKDDDPGKFSAAAELGSKEAHSAVLHNRTETGNEPIKQVAKTALQQLLLQRQMLDELRKKNQPSGVLAIT